MRYASIRSMDISDGPGIRVSIYVQGCHFHCKGCYNESTWSYKSGKEFTPEIFNHLMGLCGKPHIAGLSVLGGEPLCPENIKEVIHICKTFKELYPNKTVWCWTGYLYQNIIDKDIFKYIDVLVDGPFILSKLNLNLAYCGSENQRVIDIKQSLKENKIILYNKK